jgi:hypothetical protein
MRVISAFWDNYLSEIYLHGLACTKTCDGDLTPILGQIKTKVLFGLVGGWLLGGLQLCAETDMDNPTPTN